MSNLEQGRIIWALLPTSDGLAVERHPAVIITATHEIRKDEAFVVVVATTKFSKPLPNDHVMLPWNSDGSARTRLRKATAAVCTWLAVVREHQIERFGGIVPPLVLLEIVKKATGQISDPSS